MNLEIPMDVPEVRDAKVHLGLVYLIGLGRIVGNCPKVKKKTYFS